MVRRLLVAVGTCAALLTPVCAGAQVESTPIPAPAKPNLSAMQFIIGTWACSNNSSRRPKPFTSTSTYTLDPSGFWIDETTVTDAMSWFPYKRTAHDKITYDSDAKRWTDVSWDDMGGYGFSTAAGAQTQKQVWHDYSFVPTADIKSQTDVTTTKVSDSKMVSTSSFTESAGRQVNVVATCTKVS